MTATARPRVSVCLIVRDEAASLPGCLQSLAPLRDAVPSEVVVVDTGSRDETPALAEAAGARVIAHAWEDDFAAARNVGLDAARGDFALVLDADERLAAGVGAIAAATADAGVAGVAVLVQNLDEAGAVTSSALQWRLFRRLDAARYHYAVHEQVADRLIAAARGAGLRLVAGGPHAPVIEHFGYRAEVMRARGKIARNLRILERMVAAGEDDPYVLYNHGKTLLGAGTLVDQSRAAAALERAIEGCTRTGGVAGAGAAPPYAADAWLLRASLATGDETTRWLDRAIAAIGHDPELCHARGLAHLRAGRARLAMADFLCCIEAGQAPAAFAFRRGAVTGALPLRAAAEAVAMLAAERERSARGGMRSTAGP